jgi:K+-sensing histidine kinase KdpD
MSLFFFRIATPDGRVLCNNFDKETYDIVVNIDSGCVKTSENINIRVCKISNETGTVISASSSSDHVKSSKLMRQQTLLLLESLPFFLDINERLKATTQQHVNRLIHNLVTLNAHNIQEVYSIIPQEVMQDKRIGWKQRVIEQVNDDPYEASLALVRIAKNTLKMKTEIDVYNTLLTDNPVLKFKNHQIHRVLMNVVYVFFPEFTDKGIHVNVSESNDTVFVDYETFQVAIYHIIENTVKYIKPQSEFNIKIIKNPVTRKICINFEMVSLCIRPHEVDKIFIEGYSGEMAKLSNRAGSGIGMPRAKSLLEHNNAKLRVLPKFDTAHEVMLGREYQNNVFVVEFM